MNLLDAAAINRLQSRGYRVHGPSDPPDTASAAALLAGLGYRVFPPLASPEAGSAWGSTIGEPHVREVAASDLTHVEYRVRGVVYEPPSRITLGSWHSWKTRARAKRVP